MVIQTHILFTIWIGSNGMLLLCYGFLTKNPLRNILVYKAVSSSIVENLSSELFDNTVLLQQFSIIDYSHPNIQSIFYLAGFLWYKLYWFQLSSGVVNSNNNDIINDDDDSKMVMFDTYVTSRRITRQILFVLLYLLTKNVENVY